ncbi:DUF4349 domain-containing protein [bacterium]|nr:DUF4349 domain-containing protein [bacterium]
MAEQKQQFPAHIPKPVTFAFVGGMVVIGVIWVASSIIAIVPIARNMDSIYYSESDRAPGEKVMLDSAGGAAPQVVGNMTQDRKVTSNYVSAHVKNVEETHKKISAFVTSVSGKVVSEYVTVSSDDQTESGTMSVLVPNTEADKFFALVKNNVIKVVDRQVTSYQITQEYTDIERQLKQYEETYSKILKYYQQASSVSDLLQIQTQLDQVQRSIDSLKGRRSALDLLSSNTQYTIYSSTNEFNLPYVPQGTFEFAKTFKLAIRSLVATADSLLSGLIYFVVYTPIIALLALIAWVIRRKITG